MMFKGLTLSLAIVMIWIVGVPYIASMIYG